MSTIDTAIDTALRQYYQFLQGSMVKAIASGHIEGQLIAARELGITLGYQDVTPQAVQYATEYARLLQEEGGTLIDGEFVPWFQKYQDDLREKFTTIIQEGLESGASKEELGQRISDLLDETQRHGELIAQHEIRQVQAEAAIMQYRDIGLDYVIVVGYDLPDGTICDECQEYIDHGPYLINEAPFLPAHPNCRHNYAPYIPQGLEGKTAEETMMQNEDFMAQYASRLKLSNNAVDDTLTELKRITVGVTPPENPQVGDLWIDTSQGELS